MSPCVTNELLQDMFCNKLQRGEFLILSRKNNLIIERYSIFEDCFNNIISYHINHIISYHIISYHIISYHIISYHIFVARVSLRYLIVKLKVFLGSLFYVEDRKELKILKNDLA